jgi:hypothetical protein
MKTGFAALLLALAATPVLAHRLDEYLQNTILSVENSRVQAQMILTPGVAVFPLLIAEFDTDADGVISETEQRAYAGRVLQDLSLTMDGHRLTPQLAAIRFPTIDEMKEGRGEIQLDFQANLPRGGRDRILILENHHQTRISAYQVNCLVPRNPGMLIVAQNRNYSQSHYELDYVEPAVGSDPLSLVWWSDDRGWLAAVALLLFARFVFLWRQSRMGQCQLGNRHL